MARKILYVLSLVLIMALCLASCGDSSNNIEISISEDGYWIINGEKTDVKAEGIDGENGTDGINGTDGKNGVDGTDGKDGKDGKDGVGIGKVEYNTDGNLVITFTDGTTQTIITPENQHDHTFGEWTNHNEFSSCEQQLYYRICSNCSAIEWRPGSYKDHNFDTVTTTPTCQTDGYDTKTCQNCGLVEICNKTPIVDHDYNTNYVANNSFHWVECKNCNSTNKYNEHVLGNDGFCTVCSAQVGDTEGISYGISEDGTYAEVLGYNGTATKIKIADTYMGLPVKSIHKNAFYKNNSITSVIIPDSVIFISDQSFYDCFELTSVNIGNSVTSLGYGMFDGCRNLRSVTIGNSVASIGKYAFYGCSYLESITIPDSVTSIGECAFYECYELSRVILGNNVISIGDSAFYHCSSLTSITIPDSVTSIGNNAFSACYSLKSITIPDDINISRSAFINCNSDLYTEYEFGKYVKVENNPYFILIEITNNIFPSYTIHPDTKIISTTVFGDCSYLTSITIPNGVTSIGNSAFANCDSLTSITIPKSVTFIGFSPFYDCNYLKTINVEENNQYYKSIDGNLYSKDEKTLIQYSIGKDDILFEIPDSVTSIGWQAFAHCKSLVDITIPDSVTTIGASAFCHCDNLVSIIIPNYVTSIDNYVFSGCYNLTSIVISNVISIGIGAFYDCNNLDDVYYIGTQEEWNKIDINNSYYANYRLINATIHYNYVPEE